MTLLRSAILLTLALLLAACTQTQQTAALEPSAAGGGDLWTLAGQNRSNTRNARTESIIDASNAADLAVRWVFTTGGDVTATPAVDEEHVYLPDFAGNLFKLDRETGALVWARQISTYTGIHGDFARTTPAIAGIQLIFGNQGGRSAEGAILMSVDKRSGELLWSTRLDDHPAAIVTQSPLVLGNRVYVGVSSHEENFALDPAYPCCDFRGSVVALDKDTGEILWKTYTTPDDHSGNAVWGSMPAADRKRNSLYVTTGNNYTVPQTVLDCVDAAGTDDDAVAACIAGGNHFDSILALDLDTGAIRWATRALSFDASTAACFFGPPENCSAPSGPDFDFGEGPSLFTARDHRGKPRELLGAGQKSGQYWVVDPDTGAVIWVTQVGPGGSLGGLIWGSAVDRERIYVAETNTLAIPWTLVDGSSTDDGFWSALDIATGEILWQTANPGAGSGTSEGWTMGPVTVANGVVFACSYDPSGHMFALDAATGVVLWGFASGGSCNAGAAVVDGTVYWGTGYSYAGLGTPHNRFYAFEVNE